MITLRDAGVGDGAVLFQFVSELAAFEKLSDKVVTSAAELEARIAAPDTRAHAIIAEDGGKPVGIAIYFYNFSTFRGRHGLYIEDLYVPPAARGAGIGQQLLKALAAKAKAADCARMEWAVLDWNVGAIGFYEKLGATPLGEWITYRLEGASLDALAS